jgi:metal-responsive CopG/Arc/MetJ family transcriptional regulator
MPKKGQKSQKGIGDLYDQPKTRTTVALTLEAQQKLDIRAKQLGISRSELIEQFARGEVGSYSDFTKEDRNLLSKST